MNRRQVQSLIYEGLTERLDGLGFVLSRKAEGFIRSIQGGRQEIGVPLRDRAPQFGYSIVVCIRFDEVEELFHDFTGALPGDRSASFTSTASLAAFGGSSEFFQVATPGEVADSLSRIDPLLRSRVLPLLDATRSVAALERLVNGEEGFDVSRHPWRGMHGLILASLARTGTMDALVARYRREMAAFTPKARTPFERVVSFLSKGPG